MRSSCARRSADPVFIVYAVAAGLLLGRLAGGNLERLAEMRFHWAGAAIVGLAIQLVLFSGPVATALDSTPSLGLLAYVGSTALVLAAVMRNLHLRGLAVVAAGAVLNAAAIVANGGIMPTTPAALAAAGRGPATGFSNSAVMTDPALSPLVDQFALPSWLPLANVFSVGDVLIAVGIAATIVIGMRVTHSDEAD